MRYSQHFAKTNKNSREYDSKNATLLIKAGYIDQVMAGVYSFLPLGNRVLQEIEQIIREEMSKIGEEVFLPSLSPKELWETTKRLQTVDVLMTTQPGNELAKQKNDSEYVLNSTHEEITTPLAKKFNVSYKDLPFGIYQIQTKFRNEARPKNGLLRTREFRMKDLYSFHKNEADLQEYYEVAKNAYTKTFERLGLGDDTVVVLASGGDFTKDFSHEFQTKLENGEDLIFHDTVNDIYYNREVAPSLAPKPPHSNEEIKELETIETVAITGVEALAKFLGIEVSRTTKTILFETPEGQVVAVALRGNYEVDEEKLKRVLDVDEISLASEETVKRVTGAEIGYAGILNLPVEVKVLVDNSMEGAVNFECGANKTDAHVINVNFNRDFPLPEKFYDLKVAQPGDLNPETGEAYETFRASEVGNIFPLNTKFTEAFNYYYTDENGEQQIVYMGSYGIGPSRVMGVIAEKYSDEKGLVWPENIAPYKVHIVGLNLDEPEVYEKAEKLYETLLEKGVEVLFDDRDNVSAGEKFADADLIGIPHRVVVSKKTNESFEYKRRTETEAKMLTLEELIDNFQNFDSL